MNTEFQGEELAVKFGMTENGELQVEGYMEPTDGVKFIPDEINRAYLQASASCEAFSDDREAEQTFQSFNQGRKIQLSRGGSVISKYEVYNYDVVMPAYKEVIKNPAILSRTTSCYYSLYRRCARPRTGNALPR